MLEVSLPCRTMVVALFRPHIGAISRMAGRRSPLGGKVFGAPTMNDGTETAAVKLFPTVLARCG